jgi:hypothetical protein
MSQTNEFELIVLRWSGKYNPLELIMLKSLLERKEQNVHPCMMDFLINCIESEYVQNWYYDGDHIKKIPESSKDIMIYKIGYDHLVSSFDELNDLERMILKAFFMKQDELDGWDKAQLKWLNK